MLKQLRFKNCILRSCLTRTLFRAIQSASPTAFVESSGSEPSVERCCHEASQSFDSSDTAAWLLNDGEFVSELALFDMLTTSVIAEEYGIIACYKPYGISTFPRDEDDLDFTDKMRSAKVSSASISSILPQLSAHFGRNLAVAKTVPRYCSGIVVFAETQKAENRFRKACLSAVANRDPFNHCWAVSVGTPCPPIGGNHISAKAVVVKGKYQWAEVVNPSKRDIVNTRVKRGIVEYKTLAEKSGCSLIELHTTTFKAQIPRLMLTSVGAPILGDEIHQQKIARLFGKAINVDAKNASIKNQHIPMDVLDCLRISPKEYHRMPFFLHNYGLTLQRFPVPGREYSLYCELSPRFQRFLELVGLPSPVTLTEEPPGLLVETQP